MKILQSLSLLLVLASAPAAHAFDVTPDMLGKISYVRLELDATGHVARSTAITPDSTTFVTPNYGTTQLCRTNPNDRLTEPRSCRTYAIYIPSNAGATPMPLHLSLHGNGGFAEGQIGNIRKNDPAVAGDKEFALDNTGLEGRYNELAERHTFVAVYPNGTISEASTVVNGRNWNDCRKLNKILRNGNVNTTYSDADDVGFISALLDDVEASLSIDTGRVYVNGYSNGAMMTLRLYQELASRFTAFATVEGNMPVQDDINIECTRLDKATSPKKPVMLVFGDKDVVVPYVGGCVVDGVQVPLSQIPQEYCQRGNMMSADQTIAFFTDFLDTDPPTPEDQLWPLTWTMVNERVYTDGVPVSPDQASAVNSYPEQPDSGGTTVYRHEIYGAGDSVGYTHVYGNGERATGGDVDALTQVFVKKIQNGGHTLSGINPITDPEVAALLGPKNLDIQVADELYDFFNQFQSGCGPRNVSLGPVYDFDLTRPAVFPWQQTLDANNVPVNAFIEDDTICFPSRASGAHLRGYLFAPAEFATIPDGALPVVVIGPGSGNGQALYYLWSARELAKHGYVVLVEDPQGLGRSETLGDLTTCTADGCPGVPFQNADNFVDGFESAIAYVQTKNHPWLRKADLSRLGIAGHSLSARAATYAGGKDKNEDKHIKAVVAWDNMAGDLHGDAGTPSGEGACADLIGGEAPGATAPTTPWVPTMGQASDANGTCNYEQNLANTSTSGIGNDPELKKTGWQKWHDAGIATMEVVFTGSAHADWAQSGQSNPQELEAFEYYTRGWFDRYLYGDTTAIARLIATTLPLTAGPLPIADTTAKNGGFSTKFRSAAFMPDVRIDCGDLLGTPCVPSVPQAPLISTILDQILDADASTGDLAFTIDDLDSPASSLTVSAVSSDTGLVPAAGIVLGGSGKDRTVRITPAPGKHGATTITLTVSDGALQSHSSFLVTVLPPLPVVNPPPPAPSAGAWSTLALMPLLLAALRRRRRSPDKSTRGQA